MHTFNSCLIHCVWSTKNRASFLDSDLRERLWPYLGGIAKENKMKALAVGGAADHVHILISLPGALSVAKAIQLLKGNSSKWIHETFPKLNAFAWQEGYGAFSIGVSGVEATRFLSTINPSVKTLGYCRHGAGDGIQIAFRMCLMPRIGMTTQLGRLFNS